MINSNFDKAEPYMNTNFEDIDLKKTEKRQLRLTSLACGLAALISIFVFTSLAQGLSDFISTALKNTFFYTDANYDLIPSMLLNGIVSLIGIGVTGLVFAKVTKADFDEIMPFKSVSFKKTVGIAVIGFTVCMSANYLSQFFLVDLEFLGFQPIYQVSNISSTSILEHIAYIITVSVVPAVTEETLFRGCIMGKLRKFGDGFAIIASALLFALMHGNFFQLPFTFVVGLVLGWSLVYSGSFFLPVLIHFLNNLFAVITDILTQNLSETSPEMYLFNTITLLFFAAIFILAFTACYKLSKTDSDLVSFKEYKGLLSLKERIKTFGTSASVIIFTVIMLTECIFTLQSLW